MRHGLFRWLGRHRAQGDAGACKCTTSLPLLRESRRRVCLSHCCLDPLSMHQDNARPAASPSGSAATSATASAAASATASAAPLVTTPGKLPGSLPGGLPGSLPGSLPATASSSLPSTTAATAATAAAAAASAAASAYGMQQLANGSFMLAPGSEALASQLAMSSAPYMMAGASWPTHPFQPGAPMSMLQLQALSAAQAQVQAQGQPQAQGQTQAQQGLYYNSGWPFFQQQQQQPPP